VDREFFHKRERRPRRELDMPQLKFHHFDTWVPVLGFEGFGAWMKLYTLCDRKTYPKDNIVQHRPYPKLAKEFGCGKDKALSLIKLLYEYGLIDIVQVPNKYGTVNNHYYWYDIPIYADTTFCELKKCRSWDDTKWKGKQLSEIRKARQEQEKLIQQIDISRIETDLDDREESYSENQNVKSYSENPNVSYSENPNSFNEKLFGKPECKLFGKPECINYININNNIEDMRIEDKGLDSGHSVNEPSHDLEVEQTVQHFYCNVAEDPAIIPYIEKWVKETSKETVIYAINRLIEQEGVGNVIGWLNKAIKNPDKYPKKITFNKVKKKKLVRPWFG